MHSSRANTPPPHQIGIRPHPPPSFNKISHRPLAAPRQQPTTPTAQTLAPSKTLEKIESPCSLKREGNYVNFIIPKILL